MSCEIRVGRSENEVNRKKHGISFDIAIRVFDDPDVVHVACGSIEYGLYSEGLKLHLVTETDLAGQKSSTKDMRRMPSARRNAIDPLALQAGDYVVHEAHGVGRYVEMVQRTVQGATREYLVLEYAPAKKGQPGDRLFVPTDALDQVTKYVGGEAPSLNRLGGADWAKTMCVCWSARTPAVANSACWANPASTCSRSTSPSTNCLRQKRRKRARKSSMLGRADTSYEG